MVDDSRRFPKVDKGSRLQWMIPKRLGLHESVMKAMKCSECSTV